MPLKNETLFWKKKEYISFILSILVFFIHSHFAQDIVCDSLISVVNQKVSYFFSYSITRFAVPMFFMLSSIAFFKGYTPDKYPAKMKSRLFTLVIPYLLWNTIWMLWEIFTSYVLAGFSANTAPFPLTVSSILKGIFFYGCNNPFWFIFNLIVFSLAAPLVFLIIKNKYAGILVVIGLSVASLFGIHLPTSVFYYPMSIVFYLIGAIVGYHFFDFAAAKSKKPLRLASYIFLAAYILAKNIVPQEMQSDSYLAQVIVYTLASYALWNVADSFIEHIKPRTFHRRSFAIYAMHLPVAIVILKILSACLPQSEWLEIPKYAIMIVITLAVIHIVCTLLEKFAPKVYATLMGNRLK